MRHSSSSGPSVADTGIPSIDECETVNRRIDRASVRSSSLLGEITVTLDACAPSSPSRVRGCHPCIVGPRSLAGERCGASTPVPVSQFIGEKGCQRFQSLLCWLGLVGAGGDHQALHLVRGDFDGTRRSGRLDDQPLALAPQTCAKRIDDQLQGEIIVRDRARRDSGSACSGDAAVDRGRRMKKARLPGWKSGLGCLAAWPAGHRGRSGRRAGR